MQRKTFLLIGVCVFCFTFILLGSSYYWNPPKNLESRLGLENKNEFLEFLSQKEKLPRKGEEVSLIAVGDVSFSRGVERIVKEKRDINYPFLKIRDYLKSADLVFGNLETPITPGPEIPRFSMIFRSNPGTEQALKQAGFSIISLANNHTPNFGIKGLKDTFNYLKEAGIKYVGAGNNEEEANQPVFIEAKGIKFAFLAFNDSDVVPPSYEADSNRPGTSFMRLDKMTRAVKEAKQKANFVIVSMHSGTEYINKPNDSQVNFARAAIDAGADLVIGHHPHVVQTMEKYKGRYIFYSLGNFVFDQMWSQKTREGLAIKFYFDKSGVSKISFLPVFMENLAQPRVANWSQAVEILQRLNFPLTNQRVYSWNDGSKNFERGTRGVIYDGNPKGRVISKQKQADLDGDLIPEDYNLENGRLTITENGENIWQSPKSWWIDDFVLADSNNDEIVDINLSLWKLDNFMTSKSLGDKEDGIKIRNYFFIFDFDNNSIKKIWGSSSLAEPNCEFEIADIDNDGKNDLVVVEGDYSQKTECNGNYIALWKWNGEGFSNEWRSEKGDFNNLEVERIDGRAYILIDTL